MRTGRHQPRRGPRGRAVLGVVLVAAALVLTACAAGPNDLAGVGAGDGAGVAGFWLGLWHGIIAPVTFVISLFNDSVNIYEVRNNGNWYDAGFMLGIGGFLAGGASGRRR